jgi:hypothetical protein
MTASDDPDLATVHAPEEVLRRVHRAAMDQALFATSSGTDLTVPTRAEGYLIPDFRMVFGSGEEIRNSERWRTSKVRNDLQSFVAAFLTSVDAAYQPMLILGVPGIGKSLLLTVLAGQLPGDDFTAIPLPLGHVDPAAPVHAQVQEALGRATNGRVSWVDLAIYADGRLRVLLVDGAEDLDRPDYLAELAAFQQLEAQLGRPVAVIVTAPAVFPDRLRVPGRTMSILLEPLDGPRIERWLDVWNSLNAGRGSREITMESLSRFLNLAGSPAFLLTLTSILAAEDVDRPSTTTRLYKLVIDAALRRAWDGTSIHRPIDTELQLLGTLAAGAFNRAQTTVTEEELAEDLITFTGGPASGVARLARSPLIRVSQSIDATGSHREYGLLDEGCADHLVAAHVHQELRGLLELPAGQRKFGGLRAILSARALSTRTRIIDIVAELFGARDDVPTLLSEALVDATRSGPESGLARYAAYTANLVLLRVNLSDLGHGVAPADLIPAGDDVGEPWRSTVLIWSAGLPRAEWESLLDCLEVADGRVVRRTKRLSTQDQRYLAEAVLRGEGRLVHLLQSAI